MTLRTMFLAAALLLTGSPLAVAQEIVAEIETWRGATLSIGQPSLEVLYTTVPAPITNVAGVQLAGAGAGSGGGQAAGAMTSGTTRTVRETEIGAGPQPIQGRRSQAFVTFVSKGVEMRVPFERIAAMLIERRVVQSNMLPHYAEPVTQFVATATLTDGSTIDGASVNFGSALLRGVVPQGTIELPLEDVKILKVRR